MSGGEDDLTALIIDMQTKYHIFIYMFLISLVTTMLYVYSLKHIAKPMLYLSFVLVTFGLLGGGVYFLYLYMVLQPIPETPNAATNANDMLGVAVVLFVFLAIVLCFLICYRKAIVLGAAILQTASDFVSGNNRIVLLPLGSYLVMLIAEALWLVSIFFLAGTGTPQYVPDSYFSTMLYSGTTKWLFLVQIFIILWVLAFFGAIEKFVIASSTINWYF